MSWRQNILVGKAREKTKFVMHLRGGGGADEHFNRSFYSAPYNLFSREKLVVF